MCRIGVIAMASGSSAMPAGDLHRVQLTVIERVLEDQIGRLLGRGLHRVQLAAKETVSDGR
jgi:hypothetical protein